MTADAPPRTRITIAILALGGQGGGVLADWIIDVATRRGYRAQGTSVPGVAQRTGSTIYYIEMIPIEPGDNRGEAMLALNPVPGDVDIVIAAELMEAGRAILRGFVTADRTTLIGSTHRVYAISEKAARGDGIANGDNILAAAERRAKRFVGFDMDAAAGQAGCVISSIMFGAVAGSGALPFAREDYEAAIRARGKAVQANLSGFALGIEQAQAVVEPIVAAALPPAPTSRAGRSLAGRIAAELPAAAHPFALEGVSRLMDYQDAAYAAAYLDRLAPIVALDDGHDDAALTREAARHLALWMAYEDIARVADLKIRARRFARVRGEVQMKRGQLLVVTEYMHPRLRELCEMMPAPLGRAILASPVVAAMLRPLFARGRHVETTGLRWFVALRLVAGLRRLRPASLRFVEERTRIEAWLALATGIARDDPALATEVIRAQRLLKGYGDTFDRGLAQFDRIAAAAPRLLGRTDAATRLRALYDCALSDEDGEALDAALVREIG